MSYSYQSVSPEEAVSVITSNSQVFVHSVAAAPQSLMDALALRAGELRNVTLHHLLVEGNLAYAEKSLTNSFRVNNFFVGSKMREAVAEGWADYVPVFLSEVPLLFRRRIIDLDVAMLQVSPPDKNGYCTLGISIDTSLAAAQSAKILIAEINPRMPRTHGDGSIHISRFAKVTEIDRPLIAYPTNIPNEVESKIGQFVAEMVEDGATLQMGIGSIPDAALAAMKHHKDLGIHTEMFSDGVIPLVENGVITNKYKVKHRHHIVAGFLIGSQKLYDFVDDNPLVRMLDITYVNDSKVIMQNPKVTAVNSAIEVDLTGQICADSIGTRIYSGVGGQMDFMRGAALSEGGKPIIALPSTTGKGQSRIVSTLKPGAGVVTTRAHAHYIVTEYGVAYLFGQNLRTRIKSLINIAHPDHRETLTKEAYEIWKLVI